MKKIKISKYIRVIIILFLFISCKQVGLARAESKILNENLNKTLDLHAMAIKYDEIIQNDLDAPIDTYNGDMTGYAADCPLCGGTLGCTGKNVLKDRITTHEDLEYGTVRIVASSKNLPCGSIVRFSMLSVSNKPITAIVLDRGVTGTDLDLLVEEEAYALTNVGRKYISYDVLRIGYQR